MDGNEKLDQIIEFLSQFRDADAVAEECRKRKIEGKVRDPGSCPLSRLVRDQFHIDSKVFFVPEYLGKPVWEVRYWDCFGVKVVRRRVPDVCSRFVRAFDNRSYPDLVSKA